MYEIRNAKGNAAGTIDVEWNHPLYGWIPFTASPDDVTEHGREIYLQALQGPVAPYVVPPEQIPQEVTRFQARAALALAGLLGAVSDYMASLPADDLRRIAWEDAQVFKRQSPTVLAMAPVLGFGDAQLDQLFIVADGIDA